MTDGEVERATVRQLIRAVEETESYAFLIGAGTSRPEPAGIPTSSELIEQWQEECYEDQNREEDFDEWVAKKEEEIDDNSKYGFWFEERHPTSGERRERIQQLVEDATPTPAHIILASMMSDEGDQHYVPHILTPNFDDLLFDAFYLYLEDKPQLVDHRAVAPEFKLTRDRPAIVKLHGDYLYNNLQNTDEETEALEQGMEDALRQTVNEYGLVVVGYSGSDESIMYALLDAEISEYGVYWCTRDIENLSEKAEELLTQSSDAFVVPIKGFENLIAQFGTQIDDVEPPTRDELIERAEKRAEKLDDIVEERQEAATGEEEEYMRKVSMFSDAAEAYQDGEYRKAIAIYDDLIEHYPVDAKAYYNRGNAKAELGKFEAAIEDYTQAIDLDPEIPEVYNNRGLAKAELEEYEAAIEDYTQAIDLDHEYPKAYNNRGNAKTELEEYEAAIEDYTQAIDLNLDYTIALQNRAEARIQLGDFEQARKDAAEAEDVSNSLVESAESRLLQLITRIVLDDEIEDMEQEYRELCEEEFTTTWGFEELDSWLETADLEAEKKDKIEELIDLLREHKENATSGT